MFEAFFKKSFESQIQVLHKFVFLTCAHRMMWHAGCVRVGLHTGPKDQAQKELLENKEITGDNRLSCSYVNDVREFMQRHTHLLAR